MTLRRSALALACLLAFAVPAFADDEPAKDTKETKTETKTETTKPEKLAPKQSESEGTVTVEGKPIEYKAVAGTIVLEDKKDVGTASIFYAYYAKKGVDSGKRPIMFLYNGGPGSSTIWLHMGAFGPKRVVTDDDQHTAPAPYAWSTTITACSTSAISSSSTRRAPASRRSPTRRRGRRIISASIRTRRRSPSSSRSSCRSTAAGTRRSTCSAKATAPRVRRSCRTSCRARSRST